MKRRVLKKVCSRLWIGLLILLSEKWSPKNLNSLTSSRIAVWTTWWLTIIICQHFLPCTQSLFDLFTELQYNCLRNRELALNVIYKNLLQFTHQTIATIWNNYQICLINFEYMQSQYCVLVHHPLSKQNFETLNLKVWERQSFRLWEAHKSPRLNATYLTAIDSSVAGILNVICIEICSEICSLSRTPKDSVFLKESLQTVRRVFVLHEPLSTWYGLIQLDTNLTSRFSRISMRP